MKHVLDLVYTEISSEYEVSWTEHVELDMITAEIFSKPFYCPISAQIFLKNELRRVLVYLLPESLRTDSLFFLYILELAQV